METTKKYTKVVVVVKLEVDLDAYIKEYGGTRQEAIQSVKALVQDASRAELIQNGYIKD